MVIIVTNEVVKNDNPINIINIKNFIISPLTPLIAPKIEKNKTRDNIIMLPLPNNVIKIAI
jgi:hypothetical protein